MVDKRYLAEIAALATKLSSLHRERDNLSSEIATLEGRLKTLIAHERSDDGASGRSTFPAFMDQNRSLMDRIALLIDSDPEYEFSADAVLEMLPRSNINSVRSTLGRLASVGRIDRLDKGRYQSRIARKPM